MGASAVVLFGLIGWSVLLTLMVVAVRLKPILAGTLLFQQDGSDLPGLAQRVTRAHGNSTDQPIRPKRTTALALMINLPKVFNDFPKATCLAPSAA